MIIFRQEGGGRMIFDERLRIVIDDIKEKDYLE